MFNLLSTLMSDPTMQRSIEGIPPQFLMTKEEMLDEAAMDFIEGELSWDEMFNEIQTIEDMFKDEG